MKTMDLFQYLQKRWQTECTTKDNRKGKEGTGAITNEQNRMEQFFSNTQSNKDNWKTQVSGKKPQRKTYSQ